jgi:hypothetical protein
VVSLADCQSISHLLSGLSLPTTQAAFRDEIATLTSKIASMETSNASYQAQLQTLRQTTKVRRRFFFSFRSFQSSFSSSLSTICIRGFPFPPSVFLLFLLPLSFLSNCRHSKTNSASSSPPPSSSNDSATRASATGPPLRLPLTLQPVIVRPFPSPIRLRSRGRP